MLLRPHSSSSNAIYCHSQQWEHLAVSVKAKVSGQADTVPRGTWMLSKRHQAGSKETNSLSCALGCGNEWSWLNIDIFILLIYMYI